MEFQGCEGGGGGVMTIPEGLTWGRSDQNDTDVTDY